MGRLRPPALPAPLASLALALALALGLAGERGLLAAAGPGAEAAPRAAEDEEPDNTVFDSDIAELLGPPGDWASALARAAAEGKPVLVLLMTKWCDACLVMRASINSGQHVRQLLPYFVAVYADTEEGVQGWYEEGEKYLPQAIFLTSTGAKLPVHGPSRQHRRFFGDDTTLARGMLEALKHVGHGVAETLSEHWDEDIRRHFVAEAGREAVLARAKAEGKPAMVLLMSKACWDCLAMRSSVNRGKQARWMMSHFIVVHVESGHADWREDGHSYLPQANFFSPKGTRLAVSSVSGYKHFFGEDATLAAAMRRALQLVGGGGKANLLTKRLPSPFDADISQQLRRADAPDELEQLAAKEAKPLMVIVTQPWCQVCNNLISSINGGTQVRKLLPGFVAGHVQGEAAARAWHEEGENYVPQVHFYDGFGGVLDIEGPNPEYKRFLDGDAQVADAMRRALSLFGNKEL